MKYKLLGFSFMCYAITACEPKELGVKQEHDSTLKEHIINIGPDYDKQLYFSLELDSITGSHHKLEWDIAVLKKDNQLTPMLNSSKLMYAYTTDNYNIHNVIDTQGFERNKKIDSMAWDPQYTAMQFLDSVSPVIVIDKGMDGVTKLGFSFLQFIKHNDGTITLKYKKENNAPIFETIVSIPENKLSILVRLEDDVKMVDRQPLIPDWDLLFTQYTTNIGMVYLVAGAISQVDKIQVYLDSVNSFDAIEKTTISNYQWNSRVDNIGYAWKSYDFSAGSYILKPHYTYIIRNMTNEKTYKLQFVDFYNNQGEKGHIKFRYQSI